MPKIKAYRKPSPESTVKVNKLMHPSGKKVDVMEIRLPQDHPQVKRYDLSHPYAKAFYVSTSPGSVTTSRAWPLHELFVMDDGEKVSAVARLIVNMWPLNHSAIEALARRKK